MLIQLAEKWSVVWPRKKNGVNEDNKMSFRSKIEKKEVYGMTWKNMVHPGNGKHQENRKGLVRNQKESLCKGTRDCRLLTHWSEWNKHHTRRKKKKKTVSLLWYGAMLILNFLLFWKKKVLTTFIELNLSQEANNHLAHNLWNPIIKFLSTCTCLHNLMDFNLVRKFQNFHFNVLTLAVSADVMGHCYNEKSFLEKLNF